MSTLSVYRNELPVDVQQWLSDILGAEGEMLVSVRITDGQVILSTLDNVDPTMISRVQTTMERYRSALQRLAE